MLRAMTSAVSGLRGHQQKLDVIGNNIANVNTIGFKAQSYTFKDTMYQSAVGSTNGTTSAGGVNAAQYGYGSLMGTISMDMTGSSATYVGGFAASVDGEGFFITRATKLGNGETPVETDPTKSNAAAISTALKGATFDYTRVGKFITDSQGYVVDGNGNFVYGYRATNVNGTTKTILEPLRVPSAVATGGGITINDTVDSALEAKNVKINKAGDIEATLTVNGASQTVKIGTLAIATFQNPDGLTKDGNSYFKASGSDNTGVTSADKPGSTNRGTLMPGYLEMSNVDMAVEFSEMIMAERGFQANSKIITVSDEILSDLISMKR